MMLFYKSGKFVTESNDVLQFIVNGSVFGSNRKDWIAMCKLNQCTTSCIKNQLEKVNIFQNTYFTSSNKSVRFNLEDQH